MSGFSFLSVFECCGGNKAKPEQSYSTTDAVPAHESAAQIQDPDAPRTPRGKSNSKKDGERCARANLRKSICLRRRSTMRIYQHEVLNPSSQLNPSTFYHPEKDVETEDEGHEVIGSTEKGEVNVSHKLDEAADIDLTNVRDVMGGAKDRFDKACKYHKGSLDRDDVKFEKYHHKSKKAFREVAALCRRKLSTLDKGGEEWKSFMEHQGDAYRNLGILFNEQTPRVASAVRNFDRAASMMRECGCTVAEEKIVKHALLQSCDARLRDYVGALAKAKRLVEIKATEVRKNDVEIFDLLVKTGDKTSLVRQTEKNGYEKYSV